jgi:small subunit ribosomal protein S18
MKMLSREEREKVHTEIDRRMKELEDTGLSREEILYDKAVGIPLKHDKFFQFLKNNKLAREMLIKSSESFNAEAVIEKALKQNIGPDPSIAVPRKNNKLPEELPLNYDLRKDKEKFTPKYRDDMLRNDAYDYKTNYLDKMKIELNRHSSRPVSFIKPPMMRSQLRKKYLIKTITRKDIHWKNLPLLLRFLNDAGKLMNRYQTRLPYPVQRKLAKTVKHARDLGLLPHTDHIKPFDKIPLTSTYNDFIQDVAKVVDKNTGIIKLVHLPTVEDKFTYSNYTNVGEANKAYDEQ